VHEDHRADAPARTTRSAARPTSRRTARPVARSADRADDRAGARRSTPTGPVLVVLAAVCWGTGGLAGSIAGDVSGLSPVAVGTYRLLLAAVVLLAVDALRHRLADLLAGARGALSHRADAVRLLGVGAGLALFQVCYFLAVREIGVSVATMLTLGLAPVLVTVGAAVLLRERVGARLLVVLPVALVGLVLLVGTGGGVDGAGGEGRTLLGAAFACTSATGYAAVTLLGRSLSARLASEHVTTIGFVVAAVVCLPVGLAVGMAAAPTATTVGLLVYLGVVPTALAYGLFFAGLRHTASGTASVLTLVEPLTATVLAVLLLDERLEPWQWAGAVLLAVAVVALSVRTGRRDLPSEDEPAADSVRAT
jgi:DME family drug/metabolite transporter